jgi:hypothetical protein
MIISLIKRQLSKVTALGMGLLHSNMRLGQVRCVEKLTRLDYSFVSAGFAMAQAISRQVSPRRPEFDPG